MGYGFAKYMGMGLSKRPAAIPHHVGVLFTARVHSHMQSNQQSLI